MTAGAVVIGIGNEMRGDDAAGLVAVRLAAARLPAAAAVHESDGDVGELLEWWAGADLAVVVDAVQAGSAAGTVHRFDSPAELSKDFASRGGTHAIGLAEALALGVALGRMPGRLVVFGIEVGHTRTGEDLSPAVRAACARASDLVVETLGG